ncbi:MAG: hypothetical protein AAF004_01005 [Pseudomonadota bacterium]
MNTPFLRICAVMISLALHGCVATPVSEDIPSGAAAQSSVTFGDGEKNWIVADDVTRNGARFTFSEVHIQNNGWLVLHPFKDGKPVGEIYAGATYISSGTNTNVEISIAQAPAPGTMFLVMLHQDVNENRAFDFVFVDERNVLDEAVFEGNKMISHVFATPE